jgi:hypothetical protein
MKFQLARIRTSWTYRTQPSRAPETHQTGRFKKNCGYLRRFGDDKKRCGNAMLLLEMPSPAPRQTTDIAIGFATMPGSDPAGIAGKVEAGFRTYFPQYSWSLLNAPDRQATRFTWRGAPSKASAYRDILEAAQRLSASVCLIVDPDQRGFESNWIDALVRPGIHSKLDMVTPVYSSCSREQLISGNLLSPMLRAIFGLGPAQPMSGEFLLSARLVDHLLKRHDWDSEPARNSPELWMSFIAAAEHYRLAETAVGPSARLTSGPSVSRQARIGQIVGSLMALMERYEKSWLLPPAGMELDRFGNTATIARESAQQDGLGYLAHFVDAFPALKSEWKSLLDLPTFAEIEALQLALREGDTDRCLGDAAWVRIVYQFAAAWKRRTLPRSQVVGLFTSLWMARAGSFLMKTQWREKADVEAELNRLSCFFVALRPELQRLWTGGLAVAPDKTPAMMARQRAA